MAVATTWSYSAPVTLGTGEYDPVRKGKSLVNLTDQQIADIVAYLTTLK